MAAVETHRPRANTAQLSPRFFMSARGSWGRGGASFHNLLGCAVARSVSEGVDGELLGTARALRRHADDGILGIARGFLCRQVVLDGRNDLGLTDEPSLFTDALVGFRTQL